MTRFPLQILWTVFLHYPCCKKGPAGPFFISEPVMNGSLLGRPQHGTISWFIHCSEDSAAEGCYPPIPAAHLATLPPRIVDYLRLPPRREVHH